MKIFLRIPTEDKIDRDLSRWLLWLMDNRTGEYGHEYWDIDIHHTKCFGIAEGRNDITREFLKSTCDVLWMIDSDTVPPRNLSILDHCANYPVLCGVYQGITEKGVVWHSYVKMGEGRWVSMTEKNLMAGNRIKKVDATGGGCMVIQRHVFEDRIFPKDFRWRYEIDEKGNKTTEDIVFCDEVKHVYVDSHYICKHLKDANLLLLRQIQNSMDSMRIEMRKAGVKI